MTDTDIPKWLLRRTRNETKVSMSKKRRKRRLLNYLIEAQDHVCIGCGRRLCMTNPKTGKDYHPNHLRRPTFDHVVARSKTNRHKGNLLAMHRRCNRNKADRDPTGCELIWLEVVNIRLKQGIQEKIQRGIDAWKNHVDGQEQLSYSDSQRQRIEEETTTCLISPKPNAKNAPAARA